MRGLSGVAVQLRALALSTERAFVHAASVTGGGVVIMTSVSPQV